MSYPHKKVFYGNYIFVVYEEVYEPSEDTFLLVHNLSVKENDRVLDMGTGCGIIAVLAAQKTRKVVAVDINPHAVACAKRNAEFNAVATRIETRLGDLFNAIETEEEFDLILFNSPYLPVEENEGRGWIEKAWAGGKTGRTVIDRFINNVSKHLAKGGNVFLVQSSLSNVEETLYQLSLRDLNATIVCEEKSSFEKIALIRAKKRHF